MDIDFLFIFPYLLTYVDTEKILYNFIGKHQRGGSVRYKFKFK